MCFLTRWTSSGEGILVVILVILVIRTRITFPGRGIRPAVLTPLYVDAAGGGVQRDSVRRDDMADAGAREIGAQSPTGGVVLRVFAHWDLRW